MTQADADHFFISRDDQWALVKMLRTVPELLVHLNAVITNQERVGSGGPRVSTGEKEQPLPFNAHASEAGTALHAELAYWIRWTCEPRGITYWPVDYTHAFDFIGPLRESDRRIPSVDFRDTTVGLVMWLDRNISALAMTEGVEDALGRITDAVNAVRRAATLPKEKVRQLDAEQAAEARAFEVNATAAAVMAKAMGRKLNEFGELIEDYTTLTKRRVLHLRDMGVVKPVRTTKIRGKDSPVFIFGKLLDAHLAHPLAESA